MTSLALLCVVPLLCSFSDSAEINLALNKPAFQSSEYVDPAAETDAGNAVDGDTRHSLRGNSCMSTAANDTNPWWFVDLLAAYEVTQVTLWNRGIFRGRLRNLVVEVSSLNPATYSIAYGKLCTRFPGIAGATETLTCDSPVIGRFVRISKIHVEGTSELLTMCEVDVRGNLVQTEINLALNKPAFQSSQLGPGFGAENAVDGSTHSVWTSCTVTGLHDRNTWWVVDLLAAYEVTQVIVWNRDSYRDRLRDLVVEVSSFNPVTYPSASWKLCTSFPGIADPINETLTCDSPVIGRFVRISKIHKYSEFLTLCEVDVRGILLQTDDVDSNVALHKVTYQSSDYVYPNTSAGNAVDGNTDGTLNGNSCTMTADGDMNTWWFVDLQDVYEVTNVTLWNIVNHDDRLQNLVVEVASRLPVVLPVPEAELCTAFPGTVGAQVTLTCDAPVIGRFLIVRKVNVSGVDEHLTICEAAVRGNLIKSDCGSQCLKAEVGKRFMTDNASKFVTQLLPADCASDCHRNIRCHGLNYEMSTGTCEMIYKLQTSVDELTNATGWKYYGYDIC